MTTREDWLTKAKDLIIEKIFAPHEFHFSPIVKVSCGLCPGKAIGICVYPDQADDGAIHIFISPELGSEEWLQILGTLVHELCHAVCMSEGHTCKHGHPFSKYIRMVGLDGKATATTVLEGSELHASLSGIYQSLGEYPHKPLRKKEAKKRLSKVLTWVSETDPDYTLKVSYDLTEAHGAPLDYNRQSMVLKDKDKLALIEESLKDLEKIAEEEAEKREEEIAAQ